MRTTHLLLASAVCALLAGCDGAALTAPDAGPLAYTDVQCPDSNCGGTTVTPHYDAGSRSERTWDFFHGTVVTKGSSWSDINSDRYTNATVSATARVNWDCNTNNSIPMGSKSATVSGVGRAGVEFRYKTMGNASMEMNATHSFKASPNYPWLTDLNLTSRAVYPGCTF